MKMKSLNTSDFPTTKTSISKSEFANRTDLVSVELPSTITEIGDFAFEKCSNLESIVIPDSVQKIGVAAFCECSKLKKVVLPNGITVIEDLLFGLCESLEKVVLPDTVTVIRPQAFRECKALTTITLPNAVETIGAHCFDGCISLCECNRPTALKQVDGYAFFSTPLVKDTRYIPEQTLIFDDSTTPYVPAPIDTNDVDLTPDIMELCELLAKNTHEVWSETRIKYGWSYGEERNDANKKHPCLVPYEELSEAEKEYDRNTSIQTLKLIMKLGFHISKNK